MSHETFAVLAEDREYVKQAYGNYSCTAFGEYPFKGKGAEDGKYMFIIRGPVEELSKLINADKNLTLARNVFNQNSKTMKPMVPE